MARPTHLRFHLEPNDDGELTCLLCRRHKCDQSFRVSVGGTMSVYGVHSECADAHMTKLSKILVESKTAGI